MLPPPVFSPLSPDGRAVPRGTRLRGIPRADRAEGGSVSERYGGVVGRRPGDRSRGPGIIALTLTLTLATACAGATAKERAPLTQLELARQKIKHIVFLI